MIPRVTRKTRTHNLNLPLLALLIGALFRLNGLYGLLALQALRLATLHRTVVRVRLFVVLGARATEEEENRLRVSRAHTASLRPWRAVVKRTTMPLSRGANV
jgi:hypothetical protein